MRRALYVSLVLILCLGSPANLSAQTLALQGDHLTVNGTGRFLVFISYYDGLSASDATLETDFQYFAQNHIDGIRVFTGWDGTSLIDASGSIVPAVDARLTALLNKAAQKGLLVDLTFSWELSGGTFDTGKQGIRNVVKARKNTFLNMMIDLQNEANLHGYDDGPSAASLRKELKLLDDRRIVTASTTAMTDADAVSYHASLDITAHHDGRNATFYDDTADHVATLRSGHKPVFLDEPCRPNYPNCPNTARAYLAAVNAAKTAGAAAWTYHNDTSFDLSHQSFVARKTATDAAFVTGFYKQLPASWGIKTPK
jgi:hypothetical protein